MKSISCAIISFVLYGVKFQERENNMTNEEIIKEAQAKIIAKGKNPYYPVEQHLKDMDLTADLTKLKMKYKERQR